MEKNVVGVRWYLFFIIFSNFATFAIIYAKATIRTLLTLTVSSLRYVSAIQSIFFMVKIVVRVRRYVII